MRTPRTRLGLTRELCGRGFVVLGRLAGVAMTLEARSLSLHDAVIGRMSI